eukprot:scaffold179885_cov57-Attheya_sp.AAC.3
MDDTSTDSTGSKEMMVSVSTAPRQRPVAVGSQGSEDPSDTDNPLTASPPRIRRRRFLSTQRSSWLAPLTDETGSGSLVLVGLLGLFLVGIVLGCTLPKDMSLPTPWYRVVSSILGYTYFYSWSLSFYPQVITNIANKHTRGLSVDFCLLNVLGFTCYATYTCCLFWNPTIRRLYRERFGPTAEITVQSNDVAFALHAAILSSITLGQIIYFDGIKDTWNNRTSGLVLLFIAGSISCCIIYGILIEENQSASESQKKGSHFKCETEVDEGMEHLECVARHDGGSFKSASVSRRLRRHEKLVRNNRQFGKILFGASQYSFRREYYDTRSFFAHVT